MKDIASKMVGVDFNLAPEIMKHPNFLGIESNAENAIKKLSTEKFDVILLISVLEHLHDATGTLKQIRQLLGENGILLVNVPTWRGKAFLEFSAFRLGLSPADEMNDHKMYYDKRDLWPILVSSGFFPSNISMRYHKFG